MPKYPSNPDITTIKVPKELRDKIKRKKRGDESFADFFTRRFGL